MHTFYVFSGGKCGKFDSVDVAGDFAEMSGACVYIKECNGAWLQVCRKCGAPSMTTVCLKCKTGSSQAERLVRLKRKARGDK